LPPALWHAWCRLTFINLERGHPYYRRLWFRRFRESAGRAGEAWGCRILIGCFPHSWGHCHGGSVAIGLFSTVILLATVSRVGLEPYVGSLSLYARWTHPQAVCPPSPPTAIVHFPHKPMPRVHWTSGPSARARTRAQLLGAVRVGIGPIASWGAIWSGAAWGCRISNWL
jgi:hypothetical protein